MFATVASVLPAVPVRFTAAVEHPVRQSVSLPGTVESPRAGVVASEARGLVVELLVEEGQTVSAGDPLARLRTDFYEKQLAAAEGALKEAQARLELADSKLRRAERLHRENVISQEDLDDAWSEFTAWQGRDEQTLAEIAQLRLTLDRCTVRAPFDGVVTRKRSDVGQWIELGGSVVEMVTVRELDVRVAVPESYFDRIEPGSRARVVFEALRGHDVDGEIRAIIPSADPQARTFPILVRIENANGRVAPGMLAQVALPVGETLRAIVVPKDAVVRQGPREIVFRLDDAGVVQPVEVRSGQGVGAWVVVEGPVSPGEKVVTRGNERLRPGQSVDGESIEYPLP